MKVPDKRKAFTFSLKPEYAVIIDQMYARRITTGKKLSRGELIERAIDLLVASEEKNEVD